MTNWPCMNPFDKADYILSGKAYVAPDCKGFIENQDMLVERIEWLFKEGCARTECIYYETKKENGYGRERRKDHSLNF